MKSSPRNSKPKCSFEEWKKQYPKAYAASRKNGWLKKLQENFWPDSLVSQVLVDEVHKSILKLANLEQKILEQKILYENSVNKQVHQQKDTNKVEDTIEDTIEDIIEDRVLTRLLDDDFLRNCLRVLTYLQDTFVKNNNTDYKLDVLNCKTNSIFSSFDMLKTLESDYNENIKCVGITYYTSSTNVEDMINEAVNGVSKYICMALDERIGNCADETDYECLVILDCLLVKSVDSKLNYKENIINHIKSHSGLMRFFGAYFLLDTHYIPESTHYNINLELIEKLIRKQFDEEDGFSYGYIDLNQEVTIKNLEKDLSRLIHGMKFGICEVLSDEDYYHSDYLYTTKYEISEMIQR